jgi:hypothetical protein
VYDRVLPFAGFDLGQGRLADPCQPGEFILSQVSLSAPELHRRFADKFPAQDVIRDQKGLTPLERLPKRRRWPQGFKINAGAPAFERPRYH